MRSLSTFLLATLGVALAVPNARAQNCPGPGDAAYRIQNTWTGYVVAPEDGSDADGVRMVSAALDFNDPVQTWAVEASSEAGFVRLRNASNGLYLRTRGDETDENTAVVQAPLDAAAPAFDWRLDEGPGLCRPFSRAVEKHLRIRGNTESPPGEPIVVRTLNEGSGAQKWVFVEGGTVEAPPPPEGERLRVLAAQNWDLRIGASHRVRPWTFADSAAYSDVIALEFSSLSPGGEMKWPALQPSPGVYDWDDADRQVAFAQANGMTVHGHTLVWYTDSDPDRTDYWLTDPQQAPCSEMETLLRTHIQAVMTHYAATVDLWDVVNEAVAAGGGYRTTNRWHECLGVGAGGVPNYVRVAFDEAQTVRQQTGSTAPLLYNEVGTLNENEAMQETVYQMVAQLQSEGLAVDGVGFQFHVDLDVNQAAWTNYATRLAEELGVDVYVTEMDVRIPDETAANLAAQADLYAETLERFLHLPSRADFTLWGFTDRHSWINPDQRGVYGPPGRFYNPLLFDEEYAPKPAYDAVQRVLAGGTAREADRDGLARFEAEGHEAQRGVRSLPFARDASGQLLGRVEQFGAGDYLKFARTALDGARSVRVTYASAFPLTLELRAGSPTGELLGSVALAPTGGLDTYVEAAADLVAAPTGTLDLYVVGVTTRNGGDARLDWLAFSAGGVSAEPGAGASAFALRGAGPNPTAGAVTVRFDLGAPAEVSARVFDALGREVAAVAPVALAAGEGRSLALDLSVLPAGVYLYRVEAAAGGGVETATGRLALVGR